MSSRFPNQLKMRLPLLLIITVVSLLFLSMVIIIHLLEGLYLLLQIGYQSLADDVPLLLEYDKR